MSLVYVGVSAEGGVVFAGDGVMTEPVSGDIMALVSKLVVLPELPCVLGFTGMPRVGRYFAFATEGRYPDFDALLDGVVEDFREVHRQAVREMNVPLAFQKSCVALGGWSGRRQQFEAYRFMSYAKQTIVPGSDAVATIQPWTLSPIPYMWGSQSPPDDIMERLGVFKSEDLVDTGVRWVCAGRQSFGIDGGEYVGAIGGYVQLAVVERTGVRSWVAHRWADDVVGRPLDASRGPVLPEWMENAVDGL